MDQGTKDQLVELIQEAKRQITIKDKPQETRDMLAIEALNVATDLIAEDG